MVIFLNENGEIIKSFPVTVGRNSNRASDLLFVAPTNSALSSGTLYTAFRLPNGVELFGGLAKTENGNIPEPAVNLGELEGTEFTVWRQSLTNAVTKVQGTVSFTVYIQTETMLTSSTGSFLVERGTTIVFPDDPPPAANVWGEITSRLAELESDYSNLYPKVESLEGTVGTKPNTYAQDEALWGVVGARPNAFSRESLWWAVNALSDNQSALGESVRDDIERIEGEVALAQEEVNGVSAKTQELLSVFQRRLQNLEDANKGFSFFSEERDFSSSTRAPAKVLPFASVNEFGGINAPVIAVRSESPNILPISVLDLPEEYSNGVTYTPQKDGGVRVRGTINAASVFTLANIDLEPGSYIKSPTYIDNKGFSVVFPSEGYTEHGSRYWTSQEVCVVTKPARVQVTLQMRSIGESIDTVYYPIIAKGNNVADVTPYVMPMTPFVFTVPEAVLSLEGYGEGYDAENVNTVQFETQDDGSVKAFFVKRCEMVNGVIVPKSTHEKTEIPGLFEGDNFLRVVPNGIVTLVTNNGSNNTIGNITFDVGT